MKLKDYPLNRYQFSDKYYILVYNKLNQAEILEVIEPDKINDFILAMGMKTIKTFKSDTTRKAYNQAKKKMLELINKSQEV